MFLVYLCNFCLICIILFPKIFCIFSLLFSLHSPYDSYIYICIILHKYFNIIKVFPGGTSGKEPACHCKRPKMQF